MTQPTIRQGPEQTAAISAANTIESATFTATLGGERDVRRSRPFVVVLLAVLLALSFTAVTSLTPSTQPAAAAELSDEALFVGMINELRVSEGLQTLTVDAELTEQSRVWAEQLRANGELSHAGDLSVGVTTTWLKLGENVGVGPVDRIDDLFAAFIASPDHLANLIDPTFEAVGVGVIYDDQGRMWTTHRFMDVDNSASDGAASEVAASEDADAAGIDDQAPPAELAATDAAISDPQSDLAIAGSGGTKEAPLSAPPDLVGAGTTVELNQATAGQLFTLLDARS